MKNIIEKIKKLKEEKNAIILAHSYQNIEIDEVADFVGDSLYLSQMAKKTNADIIVFAGVYFMAQTAKIISPDKKVLLPNIKAGCLMADMINHEQMIEFKHKHPNVPVVCYINSTAEVKAECDICCTSSNAVNVVRSLGAKEILFLPDTYLGKWVEKKLGNVEFVEEQSSGKSNFKNRQLGVLLEKMEQGDILIVPELSRIARSITQIFEVIDITKQKGITLYSIKEDFSNNDKSITSTVTTTIFALVAQIERDLISLRTIEALQAKKANGTKLGRPNGRGKSKLDEHAEEILKLVDLQVPKTIIARQYNTSVANLHRFLKSV